jgi:hypothetical protein
VAGLLGCPSFAALFCNHAMPHVMKLQSLVGPGDGVACAVAPARSPTAGCSSYPITRWHRLQGVPDDALRLSAMWFATASAVVGCGIVLFNRQRVDNVSVTLRRVLYHRPTSNSEKHHASNSIHAYSVSHPCRDESHTAL